jgi:ribosome biogenesis protein YTM1
VSHPACPMVFVFFSFLLTRTTLHNSLDCTAYYTGTGNLTPTHPSLLVTNNHTRSNMPDGSESDGSNGIGEQVRVSLTLAPECRDRSLQVSSAPMAVPATVGRKGLSAVLNHLLERLEPDSDNDDDNDDATNSFISFDFVLGKSNKLLRTGIEREARRSGISLEEAIPITYFPAQQAPELSGKSEELPDWISTMSLLDCNNLLCAASYDGSIQVYSTRHDNDGGGLLKLCSKERAHSGSVQCMSSAVMDGKNSLMIATGSMDHTLHMHALQEKENRLVQYASCVDGHAASIAAVDMTPILLASADWDGGVCVWDYGQAPDQDENQPAAKKSKTLSTDKMLTDNCMSTLAPKISIRAHSTKVSGLSWGNFEQKQKSDHLGKHLITGSWDHSVKLWDVERQDCVLTLNGSRVVSCLDTSYFSSGIVATGHPDCTVRLWDVRSAESKDSSLAVSDNTFKPSHKEWVSSVKWSPKNAYHLASTSHDGTIKFWDIRSPLPLHTARAFAKEQKGLCLSFGSDGTMYAGGTDCIVKVFQDPNVQ